MRVQHYRYGIPIQKYYFAHTTRPTWRDVLLPTAYMDCYAATKPALFYTEYRHTLLTDLNADEAAIFQNFSKDARNQIRRCEQGRYFSLNLNAALEDFMPLYNAFAEKRGLSPFTDHDARAIGSENYHIFSVEHAGHPIICHFYLQCPQQGVTNLLISASSQAYNHDPDMRRSMGFANRCLHWQGMRHFKAAGFHTYDWGGYAVDATDPVMQGINRFKRTFNGKLTPIYNYYSPFYAFIEKLRHTLRQSQSHV
ncbi:MAG: GNAT family N-acetyltransferase [Candidatus Thiothrix sulfatifontis]|nr:MAG: GNAT family N-acetyltransferase [Candidatus Thiothrix sulfatifontis]